MLRCLVTGATGRLGVLVTTRLLSRGVPVRVLTRRPGVARGLFGPQIDVAEGDFADAGALAAAMRGIDRLFLLSPISERLARDQIAVAAAAERAGVRRIVKISGSDWTIDPPGRSIAGDAHALVENWLDQTPVPAVAIRPNGWMQVSLPPLLAAIRRNEPLSARWAAGGIGLIDARDIADVAVGQLTARTLAHGPLVLTGPEIVTVRAVALAAGDLLGRTIPVAPPERSPADPVSDRTEPGAGFEARAVAQFMGLIAAGAAAQTTDAVQRLLNRAPRSVTAFLAEELGPVPA